MIAPVVMLCAVALGVWFLNFLRGRRAAWSVTPAAVMIIGLWVYSVAAAWTQIFVGGRSSTPKIGAAVEASGVYDVRLLGVAIVILGAGSAVFAYGIDGHWGGEQRGPESFLLLLFPYVWLIALTFYFGLYFSPTFIVFGAFAVGAWVSPIRKKDLALVGWLTVILAALAMLTALTDPHETLVARGGGAADDKALIGTTLLAGPFGSANTLGLLLALGAPTVLLLRGRWWRFGGLAVVLVALIWSASRSSLLALGIAALVIVLCYVGLRYLAALLPIGAAIAIIYVPFAYQNDWSAFTGRGLIWRGSIKAWREHPILGDQPNFYQTLYKRTRELGVTAFHGHNVMVTFLVTGGLITTLMLGALIAVALYRAVRYACTDPVPLAVLTALLVAGVTELDLDIISPGNFAFVTWPVLGYLMLTRTSPAREAEHPSHVRSLSNRCVKVVVGI
ncbi:O-antigen ligase family protein [Gordonia polyisoprenivorans]|uniref:O-antigen ligase family protein n=1 Tax=Gordonia polyisoprenivorans TaxID=84595 RepID=UPI002301EA05|nr:O-antigen ligase family protein [Gordonia polyisoprenivorans]WCB38593.1 O-antigen ligase family protein [Gordonia polyisoprenivorans]